MIRLIKDEGQGSLSLVEFDDTKIPHYAILSHTWGPDSEEVTFKDMIEGTGRTKEGYNKIDFCRKQAANDKLQYFWVDTCCIDKSSNTELYEAINSMFRWYQNASKCYVFLSDVLSLSDFRNSRWFRRGWTLQELIAPASVEFFSKEGNYLGSKKSLEPHIHSITGIPIEALNGASLTGFETEERFSWAKDRDTKRPEDQAYSLLGIFDVFMPLIYAEGRERALKRLREEISKSLTPLALQLKTLPSPSSTVPFRQDVDFVDRGIPKGQGTLLGQIRQKSDLPAARVALVGIGGVGKSQLAIEYCYRLRKHSPHIWVFWVHASNIDRIEQGYREIAERMKIPGRSDPKQSIFELVVNWLRDETNGKWLLVLDNFDDDALLPPTNATISGSQPSDGNGQLRRPLSAYFPQSQHGTILITTRLRSVAAILVEPDDVITVDPMTIADAIVLLRGKLEVDTRDRDLSELAHVLEYMPLAIVQAAAYIRQRGARYSVRRYIEAFRRNEKQQTSLLNYEAGQLRRDSEAKNSIIVTWQISFDDIRRKWPLSADLLSLMSYCDRQGIPEKLLKSQPHREELKEIVNQRSDGARGDKVSEDRDDDNHDDDDVSMATYDDTFDESMNQLQSYSFVSVGDDGQTFEMHALVQFATRKWHEAHREDDRWKAELCTKLNRILPDGEYENWAECNILFPHAKSAERQRPTEDRALRVWTEILYKAGWYALVRGDYREAERMCKNSVEAIVKVSGEDDIQAMLSLGLLALVYMEEGRFQEAEEIQVQVLETTRRVLGEEHPDTLISMNNLASTYRGQGRFQEAEEIQVQVLETRRRVLGEEHPNTLISMNNLALTYWDQGRFQEAEEIQVQVLETTRRVLGEEHPDTLMSMNNLALTYWDQGRFQEAEKIEVQVLETRRRVLGEEHPDTLTSMNNLALTYWDQGRLQEAEEIQVQVLETTRRVLGEEHPDTLMSMNNLASTYRGQGRFQEAEEIQVQVLETRRRVLGEEHPDTLMSMNNLASTYWDQGRFQEAEKIEVQVLETRRRVLGEEHPDTLMSMNNLASTYWDQGRFQEAEEIQVQVLETTRRVLGEEHPDTLMSMNNLASTYRDQGRLQEAEEIQVQVLETTRRVLGEEHPDTLMSMNNLACNLNEQGRGIEAMELMEKGRQTTQPGLRHRTSSHT